MEVVRRGRLRTLSGCDGIAVNDVTKADITRRFLNLYRMEIRDLLVTLLLRLERVRVDRDLVIIIFDIIGTYRSLNTRVF